MILSGHENYRNKHSALSPSVWLCKPSLCFFWCLPILRGPLGRPLFIVRILNASGLTFPSGNSAEVSAPGPL